MKNLSEELIKLHEERTELFEMSNHFKEETGLSRVVWSSVKSGNEKHGPRIKVQKTEANKAIPDEWFSVTISDEPTIINNSKKIKINAKELKKIKQWVLLNKEVLLAHWNGETSSLQLANSLKSI